MRPSSPGHRSALIGGHPEAGARATTDHAQASGRPLEARSGVTPNSRASLFALAQGIHREEDGGAGSPTEANSGALLRVTGGGFEAVVTGLDLPTSLEIVGDTAYVVSLDGAIQRIDDIADPPYGR